MTTRFLAIVFGLAALLLGASGEQCGLQDGGGACPGGLCCSQFGWCSSTLVLVRQHGNCQSQCSGPTDTLTVGGVVAIISSSLFDQMLKHRNDAACPGRGFYTYNAFVTAVNSFTGFGTTGDAATQKREVAAFLAQTAHETTDSQYNSKGGWSSAPDGPYAWGYCFVRERNPPFNYCSANAQWPCAAGQSYYGRGPIQLAYNYNYGPAGRAISSNLLSNPDLVTTDRVISFKTAIWFWMTAQGNKPSSHDAITGRWTPFDADRAAGRLPGYGVITNIINGGIECGKGLNDQVADQIGFYKRYCDLLGVSYDANLDCYNQRSFNAQGVFGSE